MGHIVLDMGWVVGVTLESHIESLGHILLDVGTWVRSLVHRLGQRMSQGDTS